MTLTVGTKLGPYEITGAIGAGGMGEVYRARDTKLGRHVALKVLPAAFYSDAERMARFRREAQVLASLNHPNIAAIYGFEDSGGVHALVMELVEGPTLAERIGGASGHSNTDLKTATTGGIAKRPIPVDEALPIAKQICEALEFAHERGIVHRDLKPANIKLANNDAVKILDFGLAKALESDPASVDISSSPTISRMATQAGIILGTAAYMSPEQAKGKSVDRRADIWSFGCVLYEMLTGKMAFSGETVTDTLAAVIKSEPDWGALPANTPQTIRHLLQRCLKKDSRQRLQSIGDARITLEEVLSSAPQEAGEVSAPLQKTWPRAMPWAAAGIAIAIAALFAIGYFLRAPQPAPAIVARILPPPGVDFALSGNAAGPPVLSPDGRRLAFAAYGKDGKQLLWVQALNSSVAQPLAGTEGASFPFWSPDSRELGFFANDKLNRIDASGGPVLTLCDASLPRGGTWGRNDLILFTPTTSDPIWRVPASGGTPQPVTKLDTTHGAFSHRWPQFLPDGKHFLFFGVSGDLQGSGIYVAALDGGEPKLLLRNDSSAIYTPPGYLLFVRQGTLMAQRFDSSKLSLAGSASPLAEHAATNLNIFQGVFTLSENGLLAYQGGEASDAAMQLLWYDRTGKKVAETGTPGTYFNPAVSPDGRKMAVAVSPAGSVTQNIWVFDLVRGIKTRLTFDPGIDREPTWSPDGKSVVFISDSEGASHVFMKAADGTGRTTPLVVDNASEFLPSFSSDARYVVMQRGLTEGNPHFGIWAMPLFGDRKPFAAVEGQFDSIRPALSPDGKWIAYQSSEAGHPEIFVVPFGRGGGKWLVSTNGGFWPRWRPDGKELFYISPDYKVMAAAITAQGMSLSVGKVEQLFQAYPAFTATSFYDVAPDGKKFIIISRAESQAAEPLTLVVNWTALLNKQ